MPFFLVFVGGGVGAVLRYLATLVIGGPIATLIVNVAGSFAIGLLAGALPEEAASMRLFLITGLLGGFTTFSAFSIDAMSLWERGSALTAFAYVAASVLISIGAAAAAFAWMRAS